MKILHTSDWHLDAKLEQIPRADEHARFLQWLRQTLIDEQIDALIVAGDVFDSGTPGNAAYLRYTQFLRDLWLDASAGKSHCRNVIVVAGNHDSPSFLGTSGPLLELLGMHVVTQPTGNLREMLFPLRDSSGKTRCLVAAVPFLRERDLGPFMERNDELDLVSRFLQAFRGFYRQITKEALALREELLLNEFPNWETPNRTSEERLREAALRIPILATGHLFTAHGQTLEGDGVRPIHVGTLDQFPACDFPQELDYVALGHLHVPQIVDGQARICYSGSPIPMGFSEIASPKRVILLETSAEEKTISEIPAASDAPAAPKSSEGEETPFRSAVLEPSRLKVRERPVPCFQPMKVLRGDFEEIRQAAQALPVSSLPIWVKVEFTGETFELTIQDQIEELFQTLPHLLLVHFENRTAQKRRRPEEISPHENLKQMNENDVFARFLMTVHPNLDPSEKSELMETFQDLANRFHEKQAMGTEEPANAVSDAMPDSNRAGKNQGTIFWEE